MAGLQPTVYVIEATSDKARRWLELHLSEPLCFANDRIAVEHRYIEDIITAMKRARLKEGVDYTVYR